MRAKNESKLIGEAYGKVHNEEYDKEEDYWTTYFKKGDRIKFHTGRGFQVGGTVEDVGADAVLVRDEHGETLAVWKKNIIEVLPDESALGKAFAASQTAEGPLPGPDDIYDIGPDPEDNEAQWTDPLTEPDVEDKKPPFRGQPRGLTPDEVEGITRRGEEARRDQTLTPQELKKRDKIRRAT